MPEKSMNLTVQLDKCHDFGDIFELVKETARKILGRRRVGLMLYLADLPRTVGAYYTVGSNAIVVNRKLLKQVSNSVESLTELNSYVFTILLHEYLHALGYLDEGEVRSLVHKISVESFGEEHPTSQMSTGKFRLAPQGAPAIGEGSNDGEVEIIRDFDRSNQTYIT